MTIMLMFFDLGIIGVLSSYLASAFISRQRRREARIAAGNENNADNNEDEENDEDETTDLKAELAAMREELTAIKQLLEQHYQV